MRGSVHRWSYRNAYLAKALGVPLPRVNDIVREKRAISPEMAKDRVAKQAARIQPHPHDATGAVQNAIFKSGS